MALQDLEAFCFDLHTGPGLCITFPGGSQVCAFLPSLTPPDPSELAAAGIAAANSALAPLVPLFDLIDLCVAIVKCVEAMEDALGPPPDPMKLVQCFPDLAKKLAKLLKLLPYLTIPVLIGALLDILISYLVGQRGQILAIIRKTLRLLAAAAKAAAIGSVQLATQVDCATGDLDAFLRNMNANAQPIGRLIALLNALLELSGSDIRIPTFENYGQDANAILTPLDALIDTLKTLRAAFP